MASAFSVSRLSSFDQCRLQYKFRYIDRVPSAVETVEAFMGSRVHEALQAFYELIKLGKVESREWLEGEYDRLWQKKIPAGLKVVKSGRTAEDYRESGRKYLGEYYRTYHPFERTKVVKTEERIEFKVRHAGREYRFSGILDRLDWNEAEGLYEIHDYKTSSALPSQKDLDDDPQLGMYHLAVRSWQPEAREVKLVWHYLAFNTQLESRRSAEALEELERRTVDRIEEVEACRDFPPNKSTLCGWCGFQPLCPEWTEPPPDGV